ncbi:MAG: hypothetical protein QW176_08650 [Candidatus Bathyarchaeia archaeon]
MDLIRVFSNRSPIIKFGMNFQGLAGYVPEVSYSSVALTRGLRASPRLSR